MPTTRQQITVAAHCILGDPEEMFGSPHRLFIDSHGDVSELGFYTSRELRAWLRVMVRQHRICRRAAAVGLVAYRGAVRMNGTHLRYSEPVFDGTPAGCWPEEKPAPRLAGWLRALSLIGAVALPWALLATLVWILS